MFDVVGYRENFDVKAVTKRQSLGTLLTVRELADSEHALLSINGVMHVINHIIIYQHNILNDNNSKTTIYKAI